MKIISRVLSVLLLTASASGVSSTRLGGSSLENRDQPAEAQELESRIINGVNTPVGRYPYTVSLQLGERHFCGGSLVAPDIVLSAAHCAEGLNDIVEPVRIVLNPHNLSNHVADSEVRSVEDYVQHPLYGTLGQYDHDFMLIKFDETTSLPIVRLNTDDTLPALGSSLQVMGWGRTSADSSQTPDILQEIDVVSISNEECSASSPLYEANVSPDSLCAVKANQGSCQGDSGGPLVIPGTDSDLDVQVGVVSWGVGCAAPDRKFPYLTTHLILLSLLV